MSELAKHQVVHGDSLSSIALHYYGHGDEAHWMKIYEANKDVPGVGGPPDYLLVPHHQAGVDVFPVLTIPA